MKLAAFEELVLLVVGTLGDEAYGVSIKEALQEKVSKNPSIGALHSALYRLEAKDMSSPKKVALQVKEEAKKKILSHHRLRHTNSRRSE